MEMLSDMGSTPIISTTFQDSGQNAWVLLFPTVLGDKPSDIKAFGLSHKSFQTHLRSFQTQKTGDETGGFLHELGMNRRTSATLKLTVVGTFDFSFASVNLKPGGEYHEKT